MGLSPFPLREQGGDKGSVLADCGGWGRALFNTARMRALTPALRARATRASPAGRGVQTVRAGWLRITLSAAHREADNDRLLDALDQLPRDAIT